MATSVVQIHRNSDSQMNANESHDQNKRRKSKYDRALLGRYKLLRTIGTGNFAKVKLAIHLLTGKEVAIKVIDKSELSSSSRKKLSREVNLMKFLNHPNIVKLLEIIETDKMMYLVLEYASGGELYEYLFTNGRMKEKMAREKFRQILSAVEYCHQKHIIHRDLKMENLLLDSKLNIKLADFGFANKFEQGKKLNTFCGSPPYAAPELFKGKEYEGPEVDVWSLGVILFKMVTGTLPFDGHSLPELRERILSGKYRIPFYMSTECEKLLRKMLVVNPRKRYTIKELMKDPWINIGYENDMLVPHLEPEVDHTDRQKVEQLLDIGFGLQTIVHSLKNNEFDEITATYFLLDTSKQTRTCDAGYPIPSRSGSDIDTPEAVRFAQPKTEAIEQEQFDRTSPNEKTIELPDSCIDTIGKCLPTSQGRVIKCREKVITIEKNPSSNATRTNDLQGRPQNTKLNDTWNTHATDAGDRTRLNRTLSVRTPGDPGALYDRNVHIASSLETESGISPSVQPSNSEVIRNSIHPTESIHAKTGLSTFSRMTSTRQTIHSAYKPDIKTALESAGIAGTKNAPLASPRSNLSTWDSEDKTNNGEDSELKQKTPRVLKSLATRFNKSNFASNQNGESHEQEKGVKYAIIEESAKFDPSDGGDGKPDIRYPTDQLNTTGNSERTRTGFMRSISLRFSKRKYQNLSLHTCNGGGSGIPKSVVPDMTNKPELSRNFAKLVSQITPRDTIGTMNQTGPQDFTVDHLTEIPFDSIREEQVKPKAFRFKWYMKAISPLSAEDLVAEVKNVLKKHSLQFVQRKKFLFHCTDGISVCEVEICEVTRENQRGLRFKKISGTSMNYKAMYTKILEGLRL